MPRYFVKHNEPVCFSSNFKELKTRFKIKTIGGAADCNTRNHSKTLFLYRSGRNLVETHTVPTFCRTPTHLPINQRPIIEPPTKHCTNNFIFGHLFELLILFRLFWIVLMFTCMYYPLHWNFMNNLFCLSITYFFEFCLHGGRNTR
jgi:hypothetical protein